MKQKSFLKYVFPILSVILWIAAIVCIIKMNTIYPSSDAYTMQEAARWQPACLIGAVISTAASCVVIDLYDRMERK